MPPILYAGSPVGLSADRLGLSLGLLLKPAVHLWFGYCTGSLVPAEGRASVHLRGFSRRHSYYWLFREHPRGICARILPNPATEGTCMRRQRDSPGKRHGEALGRSRRRGLRDARAEQGRHVSPRREQKSDRGWTVGVKVPTRGKRVERSRELWASLRRGSRTGRVRLPRGSSPIARTRWPRSMLRRRWSGSRHTTRCQSRELSLRSPFSPGSRPWPASRRPSRR